MPTPLTADATAVLKYLSQLGDERWWEREEEEERGSKWAQSDRELTPRPTSLSPSRSKVYLVVNNRLGGEGVGVGLALLQSGPSVYEGTWAG